MWCGMEKLCCVWLWISRFLLTDDRLQRDSHAKAAVTIFSSFSAVEHFSSKHHTFEIFRRWWSFYWNCFCEGDWYVLGLFSVWEWFMGVWRESPLNAFLAMREKFLGQRPCPPFTAICPVTTIHHQTAGTVNGFCSTDRMINWSSIMPHVKSKNRAGEKHSMPTDRARINKRDKAKSKI